MKRNEVKRKLIDVPLQDVVVIAAYAITQGTQFKPFAEKLLADKAKQIKAAARRRARMIK